MIESVSTNAAATALQLNGQDPLRDTGRRAASDSPAAGAGNAATAPSTQVQLSDNSRLRAANDAVATAAANVQANRPAEAQQVAARDFVNATNTQNRIANEVNSAAASGDVRRASETQAALEARAAELAQIGVEREQNGNLRLDARAFEQAATRDPERVAATLERAGREVAQAVEQPAANDAEAAPTAAAATPTAQAAAPAAENAPAAPAADTQAAQQQTNADRQAEQAAAAERQQARVVTQNPFLVGAAATYRSVGDI